MEPSRYEPSPEELDVLTQVIRDITRARRLSTEDAEDFSQTVHMRLVERHYDIFLQYAGRSSLKTYLRIVVGRMLIDWRNAMRGKWRASAAARRLGRAALDLERLIYRDGHPPSEAIAILACRPEAPGAEELTSLVRALPAHHVRRHVGADAIEDCAVDFDDPIEAAEGRRITMRARAAVRAAIRCLAPGDRRMLGLRYRDGHSVRTVASLLEIDVKVVYRRLDRIRRLLRQSVLAANAG